MFVRVQYTKFLLHWSLCTVIWRVSCSSTTWPILPSRCLQDKLTPHECILIINTLLYPVCTLEWLNCAGLLQTSYYIVANFVCSCARFAARRHLNLGWRQNIGHVRRCRTRRAWDAPSNYPMHRLQCNKNLINWCIGLKHLYTIYMDGVPLNDNRPFTDFDLFWLPISKTSWFDSGCRCGSWSDTLSGVHGGSTFNRCMLCLRETRVMCRWTLNPCSGHKWWLFNPSIHSRTVRHCHHDLPHSQCVLLANIIK